MKIKYRILTHLILVVLAVLNSAVFSFAGIGFHAKLINPPLFISAYDDVENKVSFAIYPKTYPYLSQWLAFKPHVKKSNFAENSMQFETQYYGLSREKYTLTPISVDAQAYSEYRIAKRLNTGFQDNFTRTLIETEERRGRSGLGLEVALPKRLQKIFGEGSAGLKISGNRRISFAGRSNWTDDATTGTSQSKFPSLVMDQVSRFNITGTIGTKITVKVSQDSQTDIPLANRIQIRYKGDEDDILKSIEAGNTTLSLPNTEFVGYSSRIRGLFGLKTEAQIGNLRVIGIASQEKGSSESNSITAGGDESVETIRDYEYVERRIFDLVLPFDNLQPDEKVTRLIMFESVPSNNTQGGQIKANFYADPNNTSQYGSEAVVGNQTVVKEISADYYTFYNNAPNGIPYVVFNSPQQRSVDIGYLMEVTGTDSVRSFGELGEPTIKIDSIAVIDSITTDTSYIITADTSVVYTLKLLCRTDSRYSPSDVTWDLMWRNCYSIPKGSNIEDLNFKVFKGLDGAELRSGSFSYQEDGNTSVDYLEILGLDLEKSKTGSDTPDGIVDEDPLIFRPDWGLVIFPSRKPFDDTTTYSYGEVNLPGLKLKVPKLYNYTDWLEKSEASQYYIQKITTTRGSVIGLKRANIIEGSERVTVDGEIMTKGTDYDISYDFGQVTLRSERATDPNADIKIDFEYAPFFAVQKKSLLGLRAEYDWSKDLQFGTTFLYKSDKAQERKPKVGQETARTVIFDADVSLKLYPNFLTSLVDALPLVETDAKSNLTISAEIAQSHPNPNVNDVAFVDDFETALDNISLGTFRTTWKHTSLPLQLDDDSSVVKAKFLWHRPVGQIPVTDIYNRDTQTGSGSMRIFRLIFRPKEFLTTDTIKNPELKDAKTWGGMMRAFGSPLQKDRVKLFEVRLRGTTGRIHFDFGAVNEDINNDDIADTEDKDFSSYIEEGEDIGLDGIADEDEPGFDPVTNPDPNGDNWYSFFDSVGNCPLPNSDCGNIDKDDYFHPRYYDFLNGTEGNETDGGTAKFPDKESYSSGFTTQSSSAYFSYVIDLENDTKNFLVEGSERYPDGDLSQTPWVTYRIPIRLESSLDGIYTASPDIQPEWNKITHIRVWMDADEDKVKPDTVDIAEWSFVQPNWKDSVVLSPLSDRRSKFVVSSISDDVDDLFYPPSNVEAYEDPTTNVTEVQKALQLTFEDLNHYDTCIAIKNLLSIDQYSGYRRLEMYVHGEEGVSEAELNKIQFFFRLGRDDQNYYEYYTSITDGWDESNHVNIDFNDLTALKDSALKVLEPGEQLYATNEKYRVFGKPNVNEIKFLAVGVINKDETSAINGNIWIDELRVTDVRKDVGTAGRISASGNMADFITYNFSLKSTDPYFRGLSSATRGGSSNNLGSGEQNTRWSTNFTLKIDKILPRAWNASIPISLSYSKSVNTPLLRNNSDIVLPEEIRLEEQKIAESKSFSISTKFQNETGNPLFSVLLNRLNTRLSYRQSNFKDVRTPYKIGEVLDIKADYNLNIKKIPKVPVFFFLKSIPILKKASNSELALYPNNWSMNGSFNRNLTVYDDINLNRRSSLSRDFVGSMKIDYKIFDNLSTNFDYSTRRDLSNLEFIKINFSPKDFRLGWEEKYAQRFSVSYDPKLINFLTSSFSFKSTYSDDWERSNFSRRSSLTRNISVGGTFDHQALLGGEGSSRDRGFKSRRGGGRRQNVIEEEEKEKENDKFYDPVLKGMRKITGWVKPIAYSYGTNFNNAVPGLVKRPGYSYLFGFKDDPLVDTVSDTRVRNSGEGETYELSSGFTLLGGFVTTVKYRKSLSRDLIKQGTRKENSSTSWPDLSINIQKFNKLPFIQSYVNKFIDVFSPRTGYSRSVKESWDITNPDSVFTVSKSTSIGYNPLISVNFKVFRSLSLTSSITKTISINETYNPSTRKLQTTATTTKESFALSAKYSFSSPHGISIPIFGRLKFNSKIDLSMNVKFNSSITENDNVVGVDNVTNDESSVSYNPVISYSFSRQIKGGITMRWQDQKGRSTRHTREVQLWTEITF